jgi:PAS domain S-box-containing protein
VTIALLPSNETARLAALRRYQILDTPPEQTYDDLVHLAARICEAPIALLSLVDQDRQWFKSRIGVAACETGRDITFCSHAILEPDLLVIPDATLDSRFAHNPMVTGEAHVRFYAGAPLRTPDGHTIGVLCVEDTRPRDLAPAAADGLRRLARQVVTQLELRRAAFEIAGSEDLQRQTQQRWKKLMELLPAGVFETDGDGLCVYANDRCRQLIGLTEVATLGLGWRNALHPDDHDRVLAEWQEALAKGREFLSEYRYRRPDGTEIWVQCRARAVRNSDGHITGYLGSLADISSAKQAEGELRHAKEVVEVLASAAPLAIVMCTSDGITRRWSPAAERVFGWTEEEAVGRFLPIVPEAERDDFERSTLARLAGATGPVEYEAVRRHKDGREIHVIVSASVMSREGSRPTQFCAVYTDITERKLREEELARTNTELDVLVEELSRTNTELDTLVNASPLGICLIDRAGKVQTWNPACERMFGWLAVEAVDSPLPNLPEADRSRVAALWAEMFQTGGAMEYEAVRQRRDGTAVTVIVSISALRNPAGVVDRLILVYTDITERQRADERFRVLFEFSSDAHLILDQSGILDCNRAAVEMLRCRDKNDLLRRQPSEFSPEFQPDGRRSDALSNEHGERAHIFGHDRFEWLHRRLDGEVFPAEVSLTPIMLSSGPALLVVWHDITDRKRTEAILRESEERFRSLADQAPILIWMVDELAACSYFNAGWLNFTGNTMDHELHGGWEQGIHPEDRPGALRTYLAAFDRRDRFTAEYRLRRHDGEYRWVSDHGTPRYLSDGSFAGYVGVCQDVTESRFAREMLERERFFLGESIQNAPIAMAMFDTEMRYLAWSRTWVADYQLGSQPLLGRSHYDVFPDVPDHWRTLHQRALAGEVFSNPEESFERADGTRTWLRWAIHPWRQRNGDVGGLIMVTDVVSDLVHARHEALESARLKSEFLASMSHEIRTPMNGVIGLTGLLLDTELTGDQRECAEMIRSSAESLLTIINDILDFSKIEAGHLAIEPIPFEPSRVIQDVTELLAPKAQEKHIELMARLAPDVPRHLVGDAGRLRQILTNLIGNAVKFTESGHVLLEVCREPNPTRPDMLRFSVIDTGIGIGGDKLEHIFDKFTQADASTTRRFGGTGLGLAISRQLVNLMGGTITVTSEPGRGSCFSFTLPLAPDPAAGDSDLPTLPVGRRVLVVEDVPIARDVLVEQLGRLGIAVECAADGRSALDLLRAGSQPRRFDAILLDLLMPGMDGEALAREITADPVLRRTPIIAVSGVSNRPRDAQLGELGMTTFLRKPVRLEELHACLANVLNPGTPSVGLPASARAHAESREIQSEKAIGVRVLVVDDNAVNQKVAARMLSRSGCRVDLAGNGREAVEMVARLPYDLVFMDCMMPEMDGYEATGAIRQLPGLAARVPIIAMTANAMRGDRERCLEAGMDDYVSKPVRVEQLDAMVARWAKPAAGADAQPASFKAPAGQRVVDLGVLEGLRELQEEGAPDIVVEFVDLFLNDLPVRRAIIRAAMTDGDAQQMLEAAHALKSGASYIGARDLARLCAEVELASQQRDTGRALELGAALENEAEAVRRFFETWRANPPRRAAS